MAQVGVGDGSLSWSQSLLAPSPNCATVNAILFRSSHEPESIAKLVVESVRIEVYYSE
jgi:3-methyladenine DNA glycosylase AlkC